MPALTVSLTLLLNSLGLTRVLHSASGAGSWEGWDRHTALGSFLSSFWENYRLMDLKSIHTTERSQHPGFLTSRLKRIRSEGPSGVHPLTWSLLSLVLPMEDFLSTCQQPTQQGLVPSLLDLAPSPCPSLEWTAHHDNAHTKMGKLRSTRICRYCKYRCVTHLCGVLSFRGLW